ncbi:substrate-binding domain-containing protein [Microbacterium sediminis]|uniref:LacI family transcriptional regulator n=2 Tax=Microbacterium sediminis TaxID=904291 RepID=A0A1B9NCN9_9MICO|nr:substrate-binding domain-containing protein [Microbacterium sediminis]OCG74352.1 LacI family transcriptional regulator [Microbacterium sediminis]QBR73717.1 LacI family transcriptional regulator [Microbacterium sediminis]
MKRNTRIALGLALATATVGAMTGCATAGGGDDTIEVGFALKAQDAPYFVALAEAVESLGQERGWEVTVLDANGDAQQESTNIDTFISQGKDLIFADTVDNDSAIPAINRAAEAGIPVINLDSGISDDAQNVTTVYSDNKQNGRLVGKAYAEAMGDEEIRSIIISGAKGNVAGLERRTGLFAGILETRLGVSEDEAWDLADEFEAQLSSKGSATNEEAGFSVLGQGWGNWTEELGLTSSEDLITANSDITTVLGENDSMLFGAKTALDNAGLGDVDLVAAADGAKEAFDRIKAGEYFATGLNSPTLVAEGGYDIAEQILVDGADPESFDEITLTEPQAITADNVDEFYDLGF